MVQRGARWALTGALACTSGTAIASDNRHDPTPVVWEPAQCAIVVVRSEDPKVHLEYTLPDANGDDLIDECDDDPSPAGCTYDPDPVPNPGPGTFCVCDGESIDDEVSDSRRHRFFASCRQRPLDEVMPIWIDDEDVQDASEVDGCIVPNECLAGLGPLVSPDDLEDEDVAENSERWSCCLHEVGEARAITSEEAARGVEWDTSGLPVGVYTVSGYTWEPPRNEWSPRPGFIKVVDEESELADHPAAAIMQISDEDDACSDDAIEGPCIEGCETITVSGCVDVEGDATLDVWWKSAVAGTEASWQRVITDEPAQSGSFEFSFRPEELPAGPLLVRVDLEAGERGYTAHSTQSLLVVGGGGCAQDADEADATQDRDNLDEVSCISPSPPENCRCYAARDGRAWWWLLCLPLAWRRRGSQRRAAFARNRRRR